jgi:parvulin-like peptidyl-prolyl isomerase
MTFKKNLSIVSILMISLVPLFSAENVVNKVVAVVGSETILSSDLNEISKPIIEQYKKVNPDVLKNDGMTKLKKSILDQIIDEKVLLQQAKKQKITVTKRKQESALEDVKKRFKSDAEYKKELSDSGLTEVKLKERINNQLIVMDLLDKEVRAKITPPTEDEAKKYYQENEKDMVEPEAVRVRHILIKTDEKNQESALKQITDIKTQLDAGANFADLAKKYSEDKISAEKGGDLGLFMKGQMVPEFEEVAFKLNVGQISDVVKTKFGYHILRCEEKKLAQKKSYEEVQDYIKQYLYQSNMEKAVKNFVDQLKKKINITINEI